MSKRIVISGLLAVGLSLAMAGSAQAQHYGGGHFHGGGHYRGGGYGYVPVYRPVAVVPSYGYGGINSPYFGFGNSGFNFNNFNNFNNFGGYNRGFNNGFNNFNNFGGFNNGFNNNFNNFGGYNRGFNNGYSRPSFGINFGTIIR